MDDRRIIDMYFARDEQAIAETDRKYGKYCRYIAYQILSNEQDSEEIVNDTYLKAWNTIPPARPDPLKGFVGKISNQLALNRYYSDTAEKRGGGELPLVLDELSEIVSGNEASAIDEIAFTDALNNFLSSLPDRTRKIFVRRYWYSSSISEISTEYKMKPSAVTVLMLRTRKKLEEYLKKEGFEL